MEKSVHKSSMELLEDVYNVDDLAKIYQKNAENMRITYGSNWYTIYSEDEDEIYIYDLAKEKGSNQEANMNMMSELAEIIGKAIDEKGNSKRVAVELREDTSYLMYLKLLKRGLVEQIGEDILYNFEENEIENGSNFSKEEQEELLERKGLRYSQDETEKTRMHRIVFKPTKKYLESPQYKKAKREEKMRENKEWSI